MKHSYRKISIKQNKFEVGFFLSLMTLASIAIEIYFIEYLIAHGLENKILKISLSGFNFGFPILYLPIAGIVIVLLSSWISIIEKSYTRRIRGNAKTKKSKSIYLLEIFNPVTCLLLVLCIFLFLPNILGSNWALRNLFLASKNYNFFDVLIVNFYNVFFSFINISAIWKYVILQISACFGLAILAFSFGIRNKRK
jgi:hypothetical protein